MSEPQSTPDEAPRRPGAFRHSPETIAKARQMYADGVAVARICADCEMSSGRLYYWLDGGPPTGERHLEPIARRDPGGRRTTKGPIVRRRRLTGDRVALVARLWRTAEAQVRDIEDRLALKEQKADERERDARTLAVLVKTLRELTAIDQKDAPQAATEDDSFRDIDEFRRELARRMDAIVAARTEAPAGDPSTE